MKTVIFTIAFIGYVQCAKLDHLKYLPPDNRPTKQESYDQGLAAPTTNGQGHDSVSIEAQSPASPFGKSTFGSHPAAPGTFNAGSQKAAELQGSPFIPHGHQSVSGTFSGTGSGSQPSGVFPKGQQALNQPQSAYGSQQPNSVAFDKSQSGPVSQQANQPQGSYGPHGTSNQPQQNVHSGAGSQQPNQQQDTFGHGPQNVGFGGAKPAGPQGSSYGQSSPSQTFHGNFGASSGVPHGSSFAKSSPVNKNYGSQTSPGSFGSSSQPSGGYGSSGSSFGQNASPTGTYSNQAADAGKGYQGYQPNTHSSGSFSSGSGLPKVDYTKQNQGSYPSQVQSKYQPSSLNQIPIIRLDTKNYGDGTYSTAYETGNGIQAEEQGQTQGDNSIAQGSFSYTSPEGEKVGVSYTADEDGYHPQGEHLPTPPPVPEAILKSIEYNMAHPEEENDDGSYSEEQSPESNGQYKPSSGKAHFSATSNKYLSPKTPGNQFSGSFASPAGNNFGPSTGGSSSPSLSRHTPNSFNAGSSGPSSNFPSQPSTGYSSSSFGTRPQGSNGPSVSPVFPSHNAGHGDSPQPNANANANAQGPSFNHNANSHSPAASSHQQNSPSSVGDSSSPNTGHNAAFPTSQISGTFQSSKPAQGPSFNQPTHTSVVNAPHGGFSAHSGYKNGNTGAYSPTKTHNLPLEPFTSHTSTNGPSAASASPSGGAFGQSSYQASGNGPSSSPHGGVSGKVAYTSSGNVPFGAAGGSTGNKQVSGQYPTTTGQQGQQNYQASYSSSPSASKSSQSSGYQYNAPNTPFGNAASSPQFGGQSKPIGSGTNEGPGGFSGNQSGSSHGPSNAGEFGSGVSGGHSGTPGVQAQDENGGYLY